MDKEKYITEFVDIYGKLNNISENKTEVALAIFQEINKDRRVSEMNEARNNSGNEPATYKQLRFLEQNGVEFKQGLSKREASRLIDEHKRKQ